jgi:hypothetical protein
MSIEVDESSTSAKWSEVRHEVLLNLPVLAIPLRTSAKDPPPYGAQHRQDALWEGKQPPCDTHQLTQLEAGGDKALPPLWHKYKLLDGKTRYQDGTLMMASWNRPLPGVRLGEQ